MKILYFGPIAEKGKPAIGGYEAANRKNIDELRKQGVEVIEFRNPTINKKWGALGKLAYMKLFLYALIPLFYAGRKDIIIHTTYLHKFSFMISNALLSLMMKWCDIKNILDVRAGSTIALYEKGGGLYKKLVKITIDCASAITVEGKEYITGISQMTEIDKPTYYFPNLYECSNLHIGSHQPNSDSINIFYFGRITKDKGIDILLELIDILDERFHLYIAGNIAKDVDENMIKNNRKISFLGTLTHQEIKGYMSKMHFFVFPTKHDGEGQSNSLIEAMGNGLIPITSSKGFCPDVVGDCGAVLPLNATAETYKKEILHWVESQNLLEAASKCQQQIKTYHNLETEIQKLIKIYRLI